MKSLIFFILLIFIQNSHAQIFIPFSFWGCRQSAAYSEDQSNADFSAGTFTNTMVSGNSVMLGAGQTSGTFTSRVIDISSCGALWNWYAFSWRTTLPYEKEITATSETTQNYSAISNNLMNGLILYYNFNETAANGAPGGADFQDRSGNGRHGNASAVTYGAAGKLLNAATFNGTSDNVAPTSFGSTARSYTFSIWFRNLGSVNNLTYLFDTVSGGNRIIIAPTCSSALCSTQGRIGVCYGACAAITSTTINSPADTNWHHLAVTMDTATGNCTVYLDFVNTFTYTNYGSTGFDISATNVRIGSRFAADNWFFNGDIDEYAVWGRALSAAEILQIYRRGINRVRYQFRSCTSPTCADNPAWRGPDGTTGTFFSELYNNSNQAARTGNPLDPSPTMLFSNFTSFALPNNRYFQYRATLQTDNVTYSPDLNFVRIWR